MKSLPVIAAAVVALLVTRPVRADAPYGTFFVGPGAGNIAECPPWTLQVTRAQPLQVWNAIFDGGVNVAAGDVNGDGRADIIAGSGPGGDAQVAVFDGVTRLKIAGFNVGGTGFSGGVYVAAGDVNGDGRADIITGAAAGPTVKVFNGIGFGLLSEFTPYGANFRGGVRVAAGDVNGDGLADVVTGAGPGGGPQVKAFKVSNASELASFLAFDPAYNNGVYVASGKLDADNKDDFVVVTGFSGVMPTLAAGFSGATLLKTHTYQLPEPDKAASGAAVGDMNGDGTADVILMQTGKSSFFNGLDDAAMMTLSDPFDTSSAEYAVALSAALNMKLAVADVNGDGKKDLITGNDFFPLVQILTPDFAKRFTKFPLGNTFAGGFNTACGDLNGDGVYDMIMAAGTAGSGDVKTCTGTNGGLLNSFQAFTPPSIFPLHAGAGDVNGDGKDDIIIGLGQGGPPQVKVFNSTGGAVLQSFNAYSAAFNGGVRVASADFNGDGVEDILTGPGPGMGPQIKVFHGATLGVLRDFSAYDASFTGGVFVAAGDLNGDGVPEIVTGAGAAVGAGESQVRVFDGITSALLGGFSAYAPGFTGGVRVAVGDVDGDNRPDILCAPGPGMKPEVRGFAFPSFRQKFSFLPYPASFTGGVFISSWTPAAPSLTLTGFQRLANGNFQFNLLAPKGRTVYVDYTANGVEWKTVTSRAGTGVMDLFNVNPPAGMVGLYRGRCQ